MQHPARSPSPGEVRSKDEALAQYELLHEALHVRLGVEPGATTRRLRDELGSVQKPDPIQPCTFSLAMSWRTVHHFYGEFKVLKDQNPLSAGTQEMHELAVVVAR